MGWRGRRGAQLPASHPDYEQPWDEYLETPVEDASQNPGSMPSHLIDAALERIDHDRALREGDDSSERFGWERERSLYDRQGSYAELRHAIARMRVLWPSGHRQVQRVYFWGAQIQLSFDDGHLLDISEEWLARSMRGPVRVPPWLQEQQAERKERSVSELADDGMSAGEIAKALRIPKQKVRRLLAVR